MPKLSNAKIIQKIKKIRVRNNTDWMQILAIAFMKDPKRAKRISTRITKNDQRVVRWMSRLH